MKPEMKKIFVDLYSNDLVQESNADGSDEPSVQPTPEELDTAVKRFEARQANKRNKSLFDK